MSPFVPLSSINAEAIYGGISGQLPCCLCTPIPPCFGILSVYGLAFFFSFALLAHGSTPPFHLYLHNTEADVFIQFSFLFLELSRADV